MMRTFLKKIIVFIIPLFIAFSFIALYNIWLDPFGVINGEMSNQKTEPNQRYLKLKYCTENPSKYNAFLFGSSRVEKIDVKKIPDSNNWYNLGYSQAIPAEILEDLKYLIKNKIKINHVIIGLGEISYLISPVIHKNSSLRRPFVNSIDPYYKYLFLKPSYSNYKYIKSVAYRKFYTPGSYKVIYQTGNFPANKKDTFIENNKRIHKNDKVFNRPFWKNYYHTRITKSLNEIRKIRNLCNSNNIKSTFFINPIYKTTYIKSVDNDFLIFLKKLSTITSYYDFSGINEITEEPFYFYENLHYRPIVGDSIINSIFNFEAQKSNYVNENNIDSLILHKIDEIKKLND